MTCEIGFVYMRESILGSGLLDSKITSNDSYHNEKELVKKLMNARYDIDDAPERSRSLFAELVKERLNKWWTQSRYNVQIDTMCNIIMAALVDEIRKLGYEIVKIHSQNLIVDGIKENDFENITNIIKKKWSGLIMYYKIVDQEINLNRL